MIEIKRLSGTHFKAQSENGPGEYLVTFDNGLSLCTCPDFIYRRLPRYEDCKHIEKVKQAYPEVKNIKLSQETLKPRLLSEVVRW